MKTMGLSLRTGNWAMRQMAQATLCERGGTNSNHKVLPQRAGQSRLGKARELRDEIEDASPGGSVHTTTRPRRWADASGLPDHQGCSPRLSGLRSG